MNNKVIKGLIIKGLQGYILPTLTGGVSYLICSNIVSFQKLPEFNSRPTQVMYGVASFHLA